VRELDERLGFGELMEQHLTDSRPGKNTQFPFAHLLRPSVSEEWVGKASVLGFWDFLAAPKRLSTRNRPGGLHSGAMRRMLPVSRESKKEIPYQTAPTRQHRVFAGHFPAQGLAADPRE
jgi:hypothetical protein